jgi:hypothetical protein
VKEITGFILMLLFSTQAFSKWIILLEFERNQDYIAITSCENRKQPELKCGGKCQLAKRMSEEDKKPDAPGPVLKFAETIFTHDTGVISIAALPKGRLSYSPHRGKRAIEEPAFSIFHPPA